MKTKFIFLTSFILFVMQIKGQEYIPLVQENRIWSTLLVTYIDVGNSIPDSSYLTKYNKFEGDTTIGDFQYLKVYETENENMTDWTLKGCIREDTDKKVWYKQLELDEHLFYNFNAQVGETFETDWYILTIDSIKYIETNGILRKHIYLGDNIPGLYEVWIEGIGSTCGILYSGYIFTVGGSSHFLCMHENEQLILQNTYYNECWLISEMGDYEEKIPDVKVFMDYNRGIIIENNEHFEITFEIFNILGQQIVNKEVESECISYINNNLLKNCIYIYQIYTPAYKIKTQKFIIN